MENINAINQETIDQNTDQNNIGTIDQAIHRTIDQIDQKNRYQLAALNCKFTRVVRNGRPALLACISVPIGHQPTEPQQLESQSIELQPIEPQPISNRFEILLDHAANLNVRLSLLNVSVRLQPEVTSSNSSNDLSVEGTPEAYVFVLHSLFKRQITAKNLSRFLDLLTQDFNAFIAYAKAHKIEIMPEKDIAIAKDILIL